MLPELLGSVMVAAAATYWYANRIEPKRYQLELIRMNVGRVTVSNDSVMPNDSVISKPLRILHLSDLHLCHPESHKVDFIRKITDDDYDLVVLTGDIFENFSGLIYASSLLSRQPRLGAYAVLGNHDYYNYSMFNKTFGRLVRKFRHPREKRDVEPMIHALEMAGIQVLRNETVGHPDHKLHIVGIDYPTVDAEYLNRLILQAPEGHMVFVLFHVPIELDKISHSGVHLAAGGHTHGGQIRIPGFGALVTDSELPRHQASGLFWRGQTAFHVSAGLGADPRSNIRLFCPPAATILEVTYHS